ncbi:MAG: LamG-like jellyroll fold domain-containing protein, partial [Candidatus Ornithospirochaeta sp.]
VYNENKYGIGDGVYEYRVEVEDHAGHTYVSDICTVDLSDTLIKVNSFTASMEDDRVRVDLDLHSADGLYYMGFYLDGRDIYSEYFHENAQSDIALTRYVNLQNVELGSHSLKAKLVHKGWNREIYTPEVEVEIKDYVPSFKEFSLDKETVTGNEDIVVSLNIENARRVRSVSVYSDDVVIWNSGSSEEPAISKEITIPGSVLGNGTHGIRAEIESLDMKNVSRTYRTEALTINAVDVEPRATKLEAREDGDNIVLDISAVNMKGASYATIYVDDKDIERYDLSGTSTWDKSITFEKWRLGDGEHTFAVHVGSGAMMSNELGRTPINVSGVDPTIDSFTVSKDVDYVTSKLMVSNAEHIVYMRVLYDGQEQNTYSYDEGENTSLIQITKIDVSALGDGEHKIKFRLTDSIGRDYETEERTVTLTGTKPEISKCDVEVVEDQIKLDIKVDNAYRIDILRTYLDGEILREEYVYDKRSESYEETWFINVKDKDPGLHAFRVEVIDRGWNNYIKTPYVEVNFIKYVPLFESVSLDKNSLTGDETVTVNFTINNIKYINRIDITCDGRNVYTENVQSNSESKATTIERSIKLDSWKLGDGDHSIVVSVTENDEKVTSSESMSISVEGSLVEITSFETSQTDELLKFNISIIRTEHLKEVRVVSDGNVVVSESYENGAISNLDKVFTIEKWKLGDGEHTVYVEAEDYAGNVIKTEETTVNVSGANIGVSSFTITGVEDLIKLNLGLSNASHLKTIRTYVDGQSIKTENFIDKGPSIYSYEYSINKYTLQDGNHRFRMDIEDYNGNRVKTEELVFMVTGTEAKLISYSVERIEDEIVFSGELNHTNGVGSYNYFFDSSYLTGEYRDGNTKFSKSFNFDRIDNGNHRFFMEINFVNGSTIRTKDTILNIYDYKPVITECSLSKTDVNMLEDFDLTLSLQDTKHLKEIRVLSNGSTLYSKSFDDNGNGSYDSVITLNSRYFTTGTYDIVVEVEDYKKNIASKNLELNVVSNEDNGPEIVNFGLVDGTEYTENNVQVFDFSINDDGGVKTVEITLDGASSLYHFEADTYRDSYKSIPITLRLRIPYIVNGEHSILVETTDFAGNKTNLLRTFIVNKVLPEIVLTENGGPNSDGRGYYASMDSSSWVYDFALYVDGVVSNYELLNRSEESNGFGIYPYVYFDGLSEGNHTVYAKARMQSGEEIVSNSLSLTINRDVDKTKYGKDVTWNSDGTLMNDSSTLLLWNFDSNNPAYETVNGYKMGTVYETEVGLGNNSGRLYVDKSMKLLFPNSTWTVEYWAKNNSDMLNSEIDFYLRDILYSYFRRGGSASSSYYQTEIYYENMFSEIANDYIYSDISSRSDTSEWHHYAILSTGTGFEIYVDGIRRRFTEGDKPSVRVASGVYMNVPEGAYIDELRISDKARTVDELWDYVQYVRENNLLP